MQFGFDLKSSSFVHSKVTDGVTPDQRYSKEQLVKEVKKGDLFIFDLGYFCLKTFHAIVEAGGFFISRLEFQTAIFLNKRGSFTRTELTALIKKHKNKSLIEVDAEIGSNRLPCRIIAIHVPDKERNIRIRKMRQRAKGKMIAKERLRLASWNIFFTNADKSQIPTDLVYPFYRIRWSIELLFKQLKSTMQIHIANHANEHRLLCEIYGTMITTALLFFIHNNFQIHIWNTKHKEISFEKLFKFFKNHASVFMDLIISRNLTTKSSMAFLSRALAFSIAISQPSRSSAFQNITLLA